MSRHYTHTKRERERERERETERDCHYSKATCISSALFSFSTFCVFSPSRFRTSLAVGPAISRKIPCSPKQLSTAAHRTHPPLWTLMTWLSFDNIIFFMEEFTHICIGYKQTHTHTHTHTQGISNQQRLNTDSLVKTRWEVVLMILCKPSNLQCCEYSCHEKVQTSVTLLLLFKKWHSSSHWSYYICKTYIFFSICNHFLVCLSHCLLSIISEFIYTHTHTFCLVAQCITTRSVTQQVEVRAWLKVWSFHLWSSSYCPPWTWGWAVFVWKVSLIHIWD